MARSKTPIFCNIASRDVRPLSPALIPRAGEGDKESQCDAYVQESCQEHEMVSLQPPLCDFGWKARDFDLPGVDGVRYNLANARGENGLLVMFICNHCPYVKSIRDRLVADTLELKQHGVNSIAIMSNDPAEYAEDSFDNMKLVARQYQYPFPYVWDESQQVAKEYGAVCTPDFFGFNADLELQYRGRLNASRKEAIADAPRDLFNAMLQVARTGQGPREQIASMGCSIKWKNE
jgi:peroxiredoxin